MRQYVRKHNELLAGWILPHLSVGGLALLSSLLLTPGATFQAQADGPIPHIDDIRMPLGLEYPGQPFEVEVWASNTGGNAEGGGSISISLPEGHMLKILDSDEEVLSEDWSDCNYSEPHAWLLKPDSPCHRALQHHTACKEQVELRYPLAETWHKPWRSGDQHYLKVLVTPRQDVSYATVYVRVAMMAGTRGCDLRLEPDERSATGVDQQGFPVRVLVVASAPTPAPTAAPELPAPTLTRSPATFTPLPVRTSTPAHTPPLTRTFTPTPSPSPTTLAELPPGTPGARVGIFSIPALEVLVGVVLVVFLLLVIIGSGMIWRGSQRPGQPPVSPPGTGGSSPAQPSRRPPLASSLQPECLQCREGLRADTMYCPQCGAAVPVIADRYPIVRRLGQGGFGSVYLVRDQRIPGKRWAMKEMSDAAIANSAERQQAMEAFQQEAQLLATLDHPNLPRVTDFLSEGGRHYLVMDFIEGQTLENLLSGQAPPFAEGEVLDWARQLCDVLAYLHARHPPVIFRDLKPDNIMLAQDGCLKLIDFGIARLFKPGKSGDTTSFGTPGYSPPEQYGRGQTDHRSDIYALGVTLHRLLTRHDPAGTPFNLPAVRQLNPQVSPKTEKAIAQAVQLKPDHRFRNAAEMKQALDIG